MIMASMLTKDSDKLEQLVILYEKPLYLFALRISGEKFAAEDITQEAFYKIIKNINKIEDIHSTSTKSFLFTTLYRTALDYIKKRNRYESICESMDHITILIEDEFKTDEIISETLFDGNLGDCLSKLSESDKDLIQFKYGLDWFNEKIARYYNITEETLKKRLFRVKKRIIVILQNESTVKSHDK